MFEEKVFVVTVVYNGLKWIGRCFRSLKESELSIEIIFIDNGSTDGTIDYLKQTGERLKIPQENLGFGR